MREQAYVSNNLVYNSIGLLHYFLFVNLYFQKRSAKKKIGVYRMPVGNKV